MEEADESSSNKIEQIKKQDDNPVPSSLIIDGSNKQPQVAPILAFNV